MTLYPYRIGFVDVVSISIRGLDECPSCHGPLSASLIAEICEDMPYNDKSDVWALGWCVLIRSPAQYNTDLSQNSD
jgi:hypothetical protein